MRYLIIALLIFFMNSPSDALVIEEVRTTARKKIQQIYVFYPLQTLMFLILF